MNPNRKHKIPETLCTHLPWAFLSLIFILACSSCSKFIGINLTRSKIKDLDTIYYQYQAHKYWDTELVFLEKNICLYSFQVVRKKTYIGTWRPKEDSLEVSFLYKRRMAPVDKTFSIKELKKIEHSH